MERDNKEVHAHHSVDSGVFRLRVKNRVGSWYGRVKGTTTTNIVSIDMKTVSFNSLDDDTRERIKIWPAITQTALKLCHQHGAITGLWEHGHTAVSGMPGMIKNKERIKQCPRRVRGCSESKEEILSQSHVNDMGQIRGENLGHEI